MKKVCVVKHVENEGPGLIADYFLHVGWDLEVIEVFRGDSLPADLDSLAGVVILGGPMNVYQEEDYPFLTSEGELIKRVLAEEIPFLGICLGGQLLAKACGAAVTKNDREEKGWFDIGLTAAGAHDSLFRGLSGKLTIFQWHEDTFAVPEEAKLLATGKLCLNQAFKVGNAAYGLQFHPEMTPDMVKAWAESDPAADAARIVKDSKKRWSRFDEQASLFLGNFQRLMESSMRVKRTMRTFVDAKQKKTSCLWWSPEKRTFIGQ